MALRGPQGWHAVHAENYGYDRWQTLHQALHREVEHLCFLNPFLPLELQHKVKREYNLQETAIPGAYVFEIPEQGSAFRAVDHGDENVVFVDTDTEHLAPFFFVDGASAIVALALQPEDGDVVLDACAAHGGKALVLASAMFSKRFNSAENVPDAHGRLVCNEKSKEKATRLQRSMRSFLPGSLLEAAGASFLGGPHVVFTSADLGTPSNTMERSAPYDKILLDAPCTRDRDLLRGSTGNLDGWSASTAKVSSDRQLKWMFNALWLLREGGVLLFCTSALAPEECDGVVERLVRKATGTFQLELLPLEEHIWSMVPGVAAEPSDWGVRILPDQTPYGPVFFSRLRMVKRTHEAVAHLPG